MKKIFTFCLLLLASIGFSQQTSNTSLNETLTGKMPSCFVLPYQKRDTTKQARFIIRCARFITDNNEPLFVVDGIPTLGKDIFPTINPNDIDSIWIIKNAAAIALYGSDGANGVVVISTKGIRLRKFVIKDFLDGSRIAGATVLFTSLKNRNEKFQFVANDSGVVVTDKLNRFPDYQMTVSAIGHSTLTQNFSNSYSNKEREILLSREIISCSEVIVTAYPGIYCGGEKGGCRLYCVCCGIIITPGADKKEQPPVVSPEFKVYPNPVQKGASLNLQFDTIDKKEKIVRILTLDGRLVMQQSLPAIKGGNLYQPSTQSVRLSTQSGWAAGIYFIQLLYENGQVFASEKIIIQ